MERKTCCGRVVDSNTGWPGAGVQAKCGYWQSDWQCSMWRWHAIPSCIGRRPATLGRSRRRNFSQFGLTLPALLSAVLAFVTSRPFSETRVLFLHEEAGTVADPLCAIMSAAVELSAAQLLRTVTLISTHLKPRVKSRAGPQLSPDALAIPAAVSAVACRARRRSAR